MSRAGEQKSQHYQPRVEQAIEALGSTVRAAETLTRFLLGQGTPRWRELGPLFDEAIDELRRAIVWLEKPDRLPGRTGGSRRPRRSDKR